MSQKTVLKHIQNLRGLKPIESQLRCSELFNKFEFFSSNVHSIDQSELRYDDDETSEAQLQAMLKKFYIQSDIRVVQNIEKIKNVIKSYDSQW